MPERSLYSKYLAGVNLSEMSLPNRRPGSILNTSFMMTADVVFDVDLSHHPT